MKTYALLIKNIGNSETFFVQTKKTIATENESIKTIIVDEKISYNLADALENLTSLGIEESEILYALEALVQNDHNYISFGMNKGFVTTDFVGHLN